MKYIKEFFALSLEEQLANIKKIGQKYTDEILLKIIKEELGKITDLTFEIVSEGEMMLQLETAA